MTATPVIVYDNALDAPTDLMLKGKNSAINNTQRIIEIIIQYLFKYFFMASLLLSRSALNFHNSITFNCWQDLIPFLLFPFSQEVEQVLIFRKILQVPAFAGPECAIVNQDITLPYNLKLISVYNYCGVFINAYTK